MSDQSNNPTELWQGVVRYYGDLSARPDWKWVRPIFELAKQISTSQFCICVSPTITDDGLELSRERRSESSPPSQFLRIRIRQGGDFLLEQGRRGETRVVELVCTPEAAFPAVASMLRTL